jgi:DinB superfamily
VLRRPCPECGMDTSSFALTDLPAMIRSNAAAWQPVLMAGADAAIRPDPGTWSPLEYGCHVRDVHRLYDYRLSLILTQDDPLFPNWDQDETAVTDRYGEQDPAAVAQQLSDAAEVIAGHFAALGGTQWTRRGRRSDGASFTTETFARYFIHDPVHHLWDVSGPRDSGLLRARPRA